MMMKKQEPLPPEPECECENPGFCERYQINQTPLGHGVCTGKGSENVPCSPEKSQRYRRKWRLDVIRVCQSTPPSAIEKARNAAKAAAKHILDNFRRTPAEELKVREAICLVCEMNSGHKDQELGTCQHKKCGCPLKRGQLLGIGLPKPSKLELPTEKCPLGYWGVC